MRCLRRWKRPAGRLSPEPPEGAPRHLNLSPVRPAQTSDLWNHEPTHLCCFKSPHLLQQELETNMLFLGERPQKHMIPALFTVSSQSLCWSVCLSSLSLLAFTSFTAYREGDMHPTSPAEQPGTRGTDSPRGTEGLKTSRPPAPSSGLLPHTEEEGFLNPLPGAPP